jgi:undecaprenyl diphosphate synthase
MSNMSVIGTQLEDGKGICDSKPGKLSIEQLAALNKSRIPRHVAIIPDGNRRWAKKLTMQIEEGHREGADSFIPITKAAKQLGIRALTFYLFSTENWTRSSDEVALMWLFEEFLIENREEMLAEGVCFHAIGNLDQLSESLQRTLKETIEITKNCTDIDLIAALNYGSRDELKRTFKAILEDCLSGKIHADMVTETMIASYLDTAPWGDPQLLIRTSGETRLSNFLLWQLSYAELYLTDVLWPDFKPENLWEAVLYYQSKEKRLGG